MNILQALVLGVVEGTTEFLPVSSTGHLTVAEKLLGLRVDDAGVTAFTAVIQVGAIAAVLVFFRADIARIVAAFVRALVRPAARGTVDARLGWYVIVGSVPIGVAGLLGLHVVSGPLRSLWVVAVALIGWSAVMALAERRASQVRGEQDLRLRDAVLVGLVQVVALVPGVSRSGATISGGLMLGLTRVEATRLSFFLSIPALLAAGGFEAVTSAGAISESVGWPATVLATAVSFAVAYASIAWLLRLVARHRITVFIGYRIAAGVALLILLGVGALTAT